MQTHHTPGPWQWQIGNGGPRDEYGCSTPGPIDWSTWQSTGFCDNPELVAPSVLDAYGAPRDVLSAGAGEYNPVQGATDAERNANATLIAAAPELAAMVAELSDALYDAALALDGTTGKPGIVFRAEALLERAGITL